MCQAKRHAIVCNELDGGGLRSQSRQWVPLDVPGMALVLWVNGARAGGLTSRVTAAALRDAVGPHAVLPWLRVVAADAPGGYLGAGRC